MSSKHNNKSNNNNDATNRRRKQQPRGFKRPPPQEEIASLNARIQEETPSRGTLPYAKNAVVSFASQPLSQATLQGLETNGYTTMTAIQSGSIPHALAGRDILGAAKTGSGKSLAFLIPLLETLYRQGFTPHDGVGAIVLSPTRELAGQLFAVLRKIGKFHSFSLGLVMGGQNKNKQKFDNNDFVREQQALPTTNILICTPGRLLQHLEQTPYFNVDSLQMLVLDEADRILDMGFRDQLIKILDYLPTERQTLLFSATQTKSVKDLATLSINRNTAEYVGVHDQDAETTPEKLKQSYVLVPLPHKLNCLYSFLKSHLKCKTMVFFATCSQVRHAWDLFCRLRPGLSVLAIHGKLSQTKRLQVYDKFTTTPHSVLLCTDVASRGLDFPAVDWVIQVDAPEDYDMYVHRVGRTARFQQSGQALLLLDPNEEASFVNQEQQERKLKAPLQKKSINPTKTMLVSQRAAALVAEHATLYALAKKAFWSYVRSMSLLPKDGIWSDLNIRNFSWEEYALSLGLPEIPGDLEQVLQKVSSREGLRESKNVNRKLQKLKEQIRLEKEAKKKNKRKREAGEDGDVKFVAEVEEDDDLLVLKSRHEFVDDDPLASTAVTSGRKPKKIRIDGSNSAINQHVVFEDDGTEQPRLLETRETDIDKIVAQGEEALRGASETYLQKVRQRLESTKDLDKQEERERIRAKHKKKRLQEKSERAKDKNGEEDGRVSVALLQSPEEENTVEQKEDSSSDDDNSIASSDSSSSDSDNSDGDIMDVMQQEDLALSLIRSKS
ncbi:superfamily II DNA/RNA helicase [Nitzschia inconspicua]|uniref:ATP-dependent RNA helicase n=1 Tax=Nitzschia inconspicua TaxID=303405 RepID=A0A9K3LAF4_9STRA|nr:superfamily II DNA/RNA helicase [Nitzschia inconspicua]